MLAYNSPVGEKYLNQTLTVAAPEDGVLKLYFNNGTLPNYLIAVVGMKDGKMYFGVDNDWYKKERATNLFKEDLEVKADSSVLEALANQAKGTTLLDVVKILTESTS